MPGASRNSNVHSILGERPGRGQVVLPNVVIDGARAAESTFATNWIVLPGNTAERFVPDTRATAIVTKRMRDALMSSFGSAGQAVPAWISGQEVDGRPARSAHLAIVPMLDVGHSYAGGALLGVALVPPTVVPNAEEVLIGALLRLQLADADVPQMRLQFQAFGKPAEWRLNLTDDDARSSLSPDLYISKRGARRWASVTPIVFDRHPHAKGAEAQTEIESLVATSVQRIGLPAPSLVFASKHPAHEGAISAYPSGNAPAWTRWSVPASIATRPLTHAVIEFSSPIHGPLIIGAGRFMGLGLFLPMEESGRNADA
jgi:CRISPR-associated protein Csb2